MSKPKLTQEEMMKLLEAGREFVWAYKVLFQIALRNSKGQKVLYLKPFARYPKDAPMGVTKKGRFQAMVSKEAFDYLKMEEGYTML